MCIIVIKPKDVDFPSKEILKNCFTQNPDGAGFMYPLNNKVMIEKGFDNFDKFYEELSKVRAQHGSNIPYVMHFRISTQAHGRMDCTHPFPLSKKMSDLRELRVKCDIGVAHNGIISLTSSGYSKTITYSDTMQFITDYLSYIIKDKNYYKDSNNLTLIKNLAKSKLAIMDGDGHIELIGDGFIEDDGIIYSNTSYKPYKPIVTYKPKTSSKSNSYTQFTLKDDEPFEDHSPDDDWFDKFDNDYYDEWKDFYDKDSGLYNFDPIDCPYSYDYDYYDDFSYCDHCAKQGHCWGMTSIDEDEDY